MPRSPSGTWSPRPTVARALIIQAIPIGFVAALVTAGLLVVVFLDNPYTGGNGSIKPTEMSRTLTRIDSGVEAPCDERGNPT